MSAEIAEAFIEFLFQKYDMKNLKGHIPTLLKIWRNNGNSSSLNQKEYDAVSSALLKLQRGLTGKRELAGAGYMENRDFLGAYLLYYWPVTYTQVQMALKTTALNGLDFRQFNQKEELRILDLGSGPGPAGISLCDFFCNGNVRKIHVTAADFSAKALAMAEKIYREDFKDAVVTVKKVVSNFENNSLEKSLAFSNSSNDKKFDLIVMSHALNELWKEEKSACEKRKSFLDQVCNFLSDDGILFLMEPALLKTSRALIELRNYLVEKNFFAVSPCCGKEKCPVLADGENITCHGEYSWKPLPLVDEIARRAKLERNSVKMTFFVFRKNALEKVEKNIYTVVSEGMLNKSGRIRFLLCDGKKRIACSAKKDDLHAKETGFFDLKRYDKIILENPEIRGENKDAFGISKETAIAHPLQQRDSHC